MTRTMTSYSAKSIDELPTLWDGFAILVRAGLDITAFGANIMDLPRDYSTTLTTRPTPDSRSCTSRCTARARSTSTATACRSIPTTSCGSTPAPRGYCRLAPKGCESSASGEYPAASTSRRNGAPQESDLANRGGSLDRQSVAASRVVWRPLRQARAIR